MTLSRFIAFATLASGLATAAAAATMRIEATAGHPVSGEVVSDFILTFDDTGNGLLDRAEITTFSGAIYQRAGATMAEHFVYVDMVPHLAGITNGTGDRWALADEMSGMLLSADRWSYRISTVQVQAASVPVPATGVLLPLALAALISARRRKA